MENINPNEYVLSADMSKITRVTTRLNDDCSTLDCVMRDKDGQDVTFVTTLPTGPKTRVIRQTIEIVNKEIGTQEERAQAVRAFAESLISRVNRIQEAVSEPEVKQKCESLIAAIAETVEQKCPYSKLKSFVQEIDELELNSRLAQGGGTSVQSQSDASVQEPESAGQLGEFQKLMSLVQSQLHNLLRMIGLEGQPAQPAVEDDLFVVKVPVDRTLTSVLQFMDEQPSAELLQTTIDLLDRMNGFIKEGDEQQLVQTIADINKHIQDATSQMK
ncbi:Hypothetical predicted protein [Cloeon dipterum]|uniref:Uncharacterized protein n=1 Tax=Cloeon dipterum TaxID=197152 RepID=A0A8S1D349_9INSE|nr:Hypothetical predicted protein [Cloeon dipterum]